MWSFILKIREVPNTPLVGLKAKLPLMHARLYPGGEWTFEAKEEIFIADAAVGSEGNVWKRNSNNPTI